MTMTMTSREYDYNRMLALPRAIKAIEKLRYEVGAENPPAWRKLYNAGEKLRQQLSQEWDAFFVEEAPDPEPPALKGLPHTHRCPQCDRLVACTDYADSCQDQYKTCPTCAELPGLNSLLTTATKALPFSRADYPAPQSTAKWYADSACIVVCTNREEAQRLACLISDQGIDASVEPTASGYAVSVARRHESKANRILALTEAGAR